MNNIWAGLVREPLPKLEPRHAKVLEGLAEGLSVAEIAQRLSVSVKTVENYIEHARYAFGGVNRTRAAVLYDRMQRVD